MVNSVPIPKYDPSNPTHERINDISRFFHDTNDRITHEESMELEEELSGLVSSLFSLESYEVEGSVELGIGEREFVRPPIDISQLSDAYQIDREVSICPFVIVDLETTGFSFDKGDRIVEIWAGKYLHNRLIDEFHFMVNPQRSISPMAESHHNITQDMVKKGKLFDQIAEGFLEFIEGCIVVVHNHDFDPTFISGQLMESGHSIPKNLVLDTLLFARRQFNFASNSLENLSNEIGTETCPTHRAREDGLATAEVFHWMIEKFADEMAPPKLLDLIRLQGGVLRFPIVYPTDE